MVKIIKESPNNQIFLPQKSIIMIQSDDKTCRGSFSISPREISTTKRQTIWEDLCALLESIHGPWVCVGDFNDIINIFFFLLKSILGTYDFNMEPQKKKEKKKKDVSTDASSLESCFLYTFLTFK
jgi:hypothetical protein